MKSPVGLAALLGALVAFNGCATAPELVPVTAETRWLLEADTVRETGADLRRGDSRAEVVRQLGNPTAARGMAGRPEIEVLRYRRTIEGPVVMKQVRTGQGLAQVRAPIHFTETIDVFLENGRVVAVTTERRKQELGPTGRFE